MQRQTNDPKSQSARRTFLKSAGGAAAGLYLAGVDPLAAAQDLAAPVKRETLAIAGGSPAVTTLLDPFKRWPQFGEEEEKEIVAYLRDPDYFFGTYGPIAEFEKAWCEFTKTPYCKTYSSGTASLTSMLFALDLPPGSEILVPDDSSWWPVVPMRFFGLVPVWVDVNPRTINIDLEDCRRRLTKNTRAIMPVHWFGLPCDMDHICDFGKEHGLEVVEDASHSHGATLKGQHMGTWGRMAGVSLQASKPLPGIEAGVGMYQEPAGLRAGVGLRSLGRLQTLLGRQPVSQVRYGVGGQAADPPHRRDPDEDPVEASSRTKCRRGRASQAAERSADPVAGAFGALRPVRLPAGLLQPQLPLHRRGQGGRVP